jgi:hypothetical protein
MTMTRTKLVADESASTGTNGERIAKFDGDHFNVCRFARTEATHIGPFDAVADCIKQMARTSPRSLRKYLLGLEKASQNKHGCTS